MWRLALTENVQFLAIRAENIHNNYMLAICAANNTNTLRLNVCNETGLPDRLWRLCRFWCVRNLYIILNYYITDNTITKINSINMTLRICVCEIGRRISKPERAYNIIMLVRRQQNWKYRYIIL